MSAKILPFRKTHGPIAFETYRDFLRAVGRERGPIYGPSRLLELYEEGKVRIASV